MNRRQLLKLLSMGVLSHALDVDKLLWVPGEKTIFLPTHRGITLNQIIEIEWCRIVAALPGLFEKDDLFYSTLKRVKK
jgi:hypothetical protein